MKGVVTWVLVVTTGVALGGPKKPTPPKPTLTVSEPVVVGAVPAKAVAQTIQSQRSVLLRCYQAARARSPALESTLAAGFSIDRNGKVLDFDLRGRLDAAGESCVSSILRKLVFRPSKGGADAVARLTFHMGEYDDNDDDASGIVHVEGIAPINDDYPTTDAGHGFAVPEIFVKAIAVTGALDAGVVRHSIRKAVGRSPIATKASRWERKA